MRSAFFLLLCLALTAGCQTDDDLNLAEEEERPAPRVAEVDLSIGVLEGEEPYMFGGVRGVVADEDGRIYAADWQADEIRAYDAEGSFLYTVARSGSGPGEVDNPCCLTIDADGYLWARDDQNRRYNRYQVDGEGASHAGQIGIDHMHFGAQAATTFDAQGHLVDVGREFDEDTEELRWARIHRTADNTTAHTQYIPDAPPERLDRHQAEMDGGGTATYTAPFGSRAIDGHGPGGDWAFAITDRYEVVRFNESGDTLHVIERPVQGPRLSDDERQTADDRIGAIADQFDISRGDISFGVPDRKPPLEHLFFDADGRLWVQRAVAQGEPSEADVYDAEGELAYVVQWPDDVQLHWGTVTDSVAYGIQRDEDGINRIVRLRF